jgi:hypothetical protein
VKFNFGYVASTNLVEIADNLAESAWSPLERKVRKPVAAPRTKRRDVKRHIIRLRGYTHLELLSEDVAEFAYRPTACGREYRMVVVRKNISKEKVATKRSIKPNEIKSCGWSSEHSWTSSCRSPARFFATGEV